MWGPGPWGTPMWGLWWIFPMIGFLSFLVFVILMFRFISGGQGFMCMGGQDGGQTNEGVELRQEIRELSEEVRQLKEKR